MFKNITKLFKMALLKSFLSLSRLGTRQHLEWTTVVLKGGSLFFPAQPTHVEIIIQKIPKKHNYLTFYTFQQKLCIKKTYI